VIRRGSSLRRTSAPTYRLRTIATALLVLTAPLHTPPRRRVRTHPGHILIPRPLRPPPRSRLANQRGNPPSCRSDASRTLGARERNFNGAELPRWRSE
jgi:hypothetical protein